MVGIAEVGYAFELKISKELDATPAPLFHCRKHVPHPVTARSLMKVPPGVLSGWLVVYIRSVVVGKLGQEQKP